MHRQIILTVLDQGHVLINGVMWDFSFLENVKIIQPLM